MSESRARSRSPNTKDSRETAVSRAVLVVAPIVNTQFGNGMCPMLLRHSARLLFALLCVLLLTRLPPAGFAEETWSSSVKVVESAATAAVAVGSTGMWPVLLGVVPPMEALTGSADSNSCAVKHSVLRL